MKNLLEEPRQISLGGKVETFRNYAYLEERGEVIVKIMQQIEDDLDADPAKAATEWRRIAAFADLLSEVLAGQEQWLADYDAAIVTEAERTRREIRNLNLLSGIDEAEAQV